ncbi:MAG TPA: flagellar motor protein MotB [Pantanalinema sp.]
MGRRGRGGHGGHHGGAWKVAYADFVTAMMALFLVLWLTGLTTKDQKKSIADFFKDPSIFGQGKGVMKGQETPVNATIVDNPPMGIQPVPDVQSPPASTESISAEIQEALMEGSLWPFRDSIQVKETPEGIELSVVEKAKKVLFDSGAAAPSPRTIDILKAIARELKGISNHIMIGGHTDAHPLALRTGYTNWELSADRANKARTILEQSGMAPARMWAVRGFASTHPINEKDPFASENRRISIVILKN